MIPMTDTGAYLFVYGTLRKGLLSPMSAFLVQEADFVSEGYLQAKLYNVGRYPGAILSAVPAERVRGDVFWLRQADALFKLLDDYEECTDRHEQPYEYKREVVGIVTPDETKLSAWAYLYNRPVETLLRIASGDYLQFLNGMAIDKIE